MADTLPEQLRSRDTDRLRRYADNLAFYRGHQWDVPPRRLTQRGQRELTLNYTRAVIRKAASYLMTDLAFVADPVDDTQRSVDLARAAEEALRLVADQNALDTLDFDNELDVSVLGDAAYKVTWDAGEGRVRVTAPDMTGVYVWRRPDDPAQVWRVVQRYTLPQADALDLYGIVSVQREPEIIEEWTATAFRLWVDGAPVRDEPNPYAAIPYVVYPNIREPKEQWGTSDIDDIRDVAREFNRVTTQLSRIIELSGNPITVLENVTESSDIGVQPGAVWELPENAKAYLLDLLQGGGVRIAIDYADLIRRAFHDLSESPATAFGQNDRALSGVALNIALDPLVKKVARKRLIRARALADRARLILGILAQNGQLPDDAIAAQPVRAQWGDVLPNDRSADVADEIALVNAGVHSRRRAAAAVGVENPDDELARWLEEAEQVAAVQPTQTPTPQAAQNRARR